MLICFYIDCKQMVSLARGACTQTVCRMEIKMKLRNVLIVVKDIEQSKKYYHDLFGLEMLLDNGGNMILSEGLVLQEEECWKDFLQGDVLLRNNHSELYFEEAEIESFVDKLWHKNGKCRQCWQSYNYDCKYHTASVKIKT